MHEHRCGWQRRQRRQGGAVQPDQPGWFQEQRCGHATCQKYIQYVSGVAERLQKYMQYVCMCWTGSTTYMQCAYNMHTLERHKYPFAHIPHSHIRHGHGAAYIPTPMPLSLFVRGGRAAPTYIPTPMHKYPFDTCRYNMHMLERRDGVHLKPSRQTCATCQI